MREPALSEPLRHFAESCFTSPVAFREVSWPHGESNVWAVECDGQTVAFLKQHRRRIKFSTELGAYHEVVPVLGDLAPRLLGVHDGDPPALLLSTLPGTIVAEVDWPAHVEYELHVRAARLLRRLHDIPVDESERHQVEARTRESLATWMERARKYFPAGIIEWAIEQVEAGIAEASPLCICHKDFSPRNWIAAQDGTVGLIDFERTCIDFQYLDWHRLWMREWLKRPDLKDAFFEGYGVVDGDWEPTMRRLMTLQAVGGVAWATEHNDPKFAEENRRVVERLRR